MTVLALMLLLVPLQEAFDSLSVDVELSRRQGWRFAAKLVRGAYMYQERERAQELGYDDPINPTYEATNRMYHRLVSHCRTSSGDVHQEQWRST